MGLSVIYDKTYPLQGEGMYDDGSAVGLITTINSLLDITQSLSEGEELIVTLNMSREYLEVIDAFDVLVHREGLKKEIFRILESEFNYKPKIHRHIKDKLTVNYSLYKFYIVYDYFETEDLFYIFRVRW